MLVRGVGGETTVRAYRRFYPGARVNAVEVAWPFLKKGGEAFDVIELRPIARQAMLALRPAVPCRVVLTADRAPVEQLTHEMLARQDRLRAGGR